MSRIKDDLARKTYIEDLKAVASSAQGRRVLKSLLERAGIHRMSFHSGPGGAELTAFAEGQRSMGNALMLDMSEADDTMYLRVISEKSL